MFDLDCVVLPAARNGTLVYVMSQWTTSPVQPGGKWGDLTGGYCAGLAVRWIRLAYAGRDYKAVGTEAGGVSLKAYTGTDELAASYQAKVRDTAALRGSATPTWIAEYILGLAQMKLGGELRAEGTGKPTGAKLTGVVRRSYGCYWVHLEGPTSSHVFAIRHARPSGGDGPGEFHIFDPNYGHFMWQAPAANWNNIVDWFLVATGYDKAYASNWLVGRVTPPVNHASA